MTASTATQAKVLRLTMTVGETSAPYNQFTLPLRNRQQITLCPLQRATVTPPDDLHFIDGDGTIGTFWHNIRPLLRNERYDVIHVHDAVVANLYLVLLFITNPRLLSISLFTVHNSYENFKLRNRLLLLPIFALFRKVICCSRASYESFPWLYRFLAGKRLTYVQNGMDIARVDETLASNERDTSPSVATEEFTIISVGRLIAIKNPLALLDAFIAADVPNSRLVFVGVGPLHDIIYARAEAAGVVDQVEFTGLLPRNEVYRRLVAADIYASTSHGEGLPIAVLEAMACRTPVVLSAIAPHREIAESLTGIPLLDANDSAGFAQAISHFAAMSAEERSVVGEQCRQEVERHFSLQQMHRGYAEIYAEVIGGNNRPGLTSPTFQ